MLARGGVGRMRLVDFDQVSLSSLNRHACATRADVGRPKVECCAEYFAKFNPHCEVDAKAAMFEGAKAAELLAG
jgi:tRNA A37 threonylcarbamoyladenosine dehydratase